MPQLNIKNERAHELASRLSRLSGKSMSECIVDALEEKLDREQRLRGREGISERLLAIGREIASRPKIDPRPLDEIMDDLYDEHGLPK